MVERPNEALQTTAASPRVIERSEGMLIVSGLSAAVSELVRSAASIRQQVALSCPGIF